MLEENSIIGIYGHYSDQDMATQKKELGSSYYLIYLFDQNGIIDTNSSKRIYRDLFKRSTEEKQTKIGPFENTTELSQYAFELCDRMNAGKICLHSVQDYNSLMTEISTVDEWKKALLEKGNCIQNPDKNKGQKGFFSRMFS